MLGIVMTVPISSGAEFARKSGLTVTIAGHDTTGVAVCNQVRSFDIQARIRSGNACYVETLDTATTEEIISRVISVIDPEH
jgi:mRNA interferase ChpB